jgi:hypothetical protein
VSLAAGSYAHHKTDVTPHCATVGSQPRLGRPRRSHGYGRRERFATSRMDRGYPPSSVAQEGDVMRCTGRYGEGSVAAWTVRSGRLAVSST